MQIFKTRKDASQGVKRFARQYDPEGSYDYRTFHHVKFPCTKTSQYLVEIISSRGVFLSYL